MAPKPSAGILLFRRRGTHVEVLLGHMGGPFWARRDAAAWSLPKGEYGPDEEPLAAARREFEEEIGLPLPDGEPVGLGESRERSGKVVTIWAVEGDLDPAVAVPGTFHMEWPRGSGQLREFPEIDRVEWFDVDEAHDRMVGGQQVFLERLRAHLGGGGDR